MGLGTLVRASLVPAGRDGRRFGLATLIDSFGTGMFLTGSAVYFTRIIGLSAVQVGVGLSVAGLVGLVLSVPLGMLGDRFGPGRIYLALQVWRGLGYAAYLLVAGFPGFVAVAAAIEIGDAALPAVFQAMVSLAVPATERVSTLAKVRAVRNLGFALGAAAATGALALGSRPAFLALVLANAVALLGSAVLLRYGTDVVLLRARVVVRRFELARDRFYLAAAVLNGILSIHMSALFIGLPLWLATHTRVPVVLIGVLVAVNTIMAVTLQAPLATRAETLHGAVQCMALAGFALAGFAAAAYLTSEVRTVAVASSLAVAAVVLLTLGELWQSGGGWSISYELAPAGRQTQYLATFQLGTALQVTAGPAIITGLVFPHALGWPLFALVVAAAGMVVRPVVRAAARAQK